jgi:nucleoside-diphosphate-sugar epimerase
MNVSVIGAAGFLGLALREYLQDTQHRVQAFSKKPIVGFQNEVLVEADVTRDFPYEKLLQHDIVFYCAGIGVQSGVATDKKELYLVNTYFPIALTQYLEENNFKGTLVTFGSYFEIGNNDRDKKFTEEEVVFSKYAVPNAYCISKRLFTKYVHDNKTLVKHLHFILPTIYGEHENSNRLIPYIVNGIKNKQPLSFTSGNQVRQYLYVNNLANIIFTLSNQLPAGIYNVPASNTLTIKELANTIARYFNFSLGDTSMLCLQLDAGVIEAMIPGFHYTLIEEVIPKY